MTATATQDKRERTREFGEFLAESLDELREEIVEAIQTDLPDIIARIPDVLEELVCGPKEEEPAQPTDAGPCVGRGFSHAGPA